MSGNATKRSRLLGELDDLLSEVDEALFLTVSGLQRTADAVEQTLQFSAPAMSGYFYDTYPMWELRWEIAAEDPTWTRCNPQPCKGHPYCACVHYDTPRQSLPLGKIDYNTHANREVEELILNGRYEPEAGRWKARNFPCF